MSYEYEGAHNYEDPHKSKTHKRGEPPLVIVSHKLVRLVIVSLN
jgi:hypothetical protein